jgi:hypothetical protein
VVGLGLVSAVELEVRRVAGAFAVGLGLALVVELEVWVPVE